MSSRYNFTIVIEPAEEGGYNVMVPALPGCLTQGETLDEAKKMAEDAIRAYCESLLMDGEKIPVEKRDAGEFIGHVSLDLQPA